MEPQYRYKLVYADDPTSNEEKILTWGQILMKEPWLEYFSMSPPDNLELKLTYDLVYLEIKG